MKTFMDRQIPYSQNTSPLANIPITINLMEVFPKHEN